MNTRQPMQIPEGTLFGTLTVIKEVERSGYNRRFLCLCSCGKETIKFLGNLRAGRAIDCGHGGLYSEESRAKIIATRHAIAEWTNEGRKCAGCGIWQTWDRFKKNYRTVNGREARCRTCDRWALIEHTYGVSQSEWESLLKSQDDKCALCLEPSDRMLNTDHDHGCCGPKKACKKCIRGLLCDICNRMLGLIEQKPSLAIRFSEYLNRRPFTGFTNTIDENMTTGISDQ